MIDDTKSEKLDFIKSHNVPYIKTPTYELQNIFQFALIKDITDLECFGCYLESDQTCKSCYLADTNYCQDYQKYLNIISEKIMRISEGLNMEKIEAILTQLKLKPTTKLFTITKLVLESNGKPYNLLLEEIKTLCGKDVSNAYVKTKFYQVRRLIQQKIPLKIVVETQRIIKFQ